MAERRGHRRRRSGRLGLPSRLDQQNVPLPPEAACCGERSPTPKRLRRPPRRSQTQGPGHRRLPPVHVDWVAVGAVATVLAVVTALVIAIWGDRLKALTSRPNLTLSIAMRPPDCHHIQTTAQIQISPPMGSLGGAVAATRTVPIGAYDTYYFRVSVGNDGNAAARNVGVRAIKLFRRNPNTNTYAEDPSFMSMDLTWSHANGSVVVAKIDPNLPKHCDLAHVDQPKSGFLQFNTEVTPNEVAPGVWPTVKPAGEYRLDVAVTADNAKPLYRTLKIAFDGNWYKTEAEMFTKGVVITAAP